MARLAGREINRSEYAQGVEENNKRYQENPQLYYFGYEKSSQLLINNKDVFKISRNTSDFRSPEEVINGCFVEANMDSNNKFNSLKRLLTLFKIEDELSIKNMHRDKKTRRNQIVLMLEKNIGNNYYHW